MNLLKKSAIISLGLGLVISLNSCVIGHHHHTTTRTVKHDNGKHKGWYKAKKGNGNSGNSNGNSGHGNKHGKH